MIYKKTNRYVYRNVAGEGVLVPVRGGICNLENMLILNDTSTVIWERMKKAETINPDELSEWLCGEYEIEKSQAQKDVKTFLKELVESECIECA